MPIFLSKFPTIWIYVSEFRHEFRAMNFTKKKFTYYNKNLANRQNRYNKMWQLIGCNRQQGVGTQRISFQENISRFLQKKKLESNLKLYSLTESKSITESSFENIHLLNMKIGRETVRKTRKIAELKRKRLWANAVAISS